MNHFISCIVPVYNGERYIEEALDSILAQNWRPLEVLVVDDGSTDRTGDIAREVAERTPVVHVVTQKNAGPAVARNTGLARCGGELICFLDADDLWHPEKLVRQVARFDADPKLDYCVHHVQNFWEQDLADEAERYRDHARGQPIPGYVTQCLMARRQSFERVGYFDPGLHHGDSMDWFLRARATGLVGELMPDVLSYRRMHEGNRSRTKASRSLEEFFGILKQSLDRKRVAEGAV
ncbi:MAG: glycosyltransferase family 2 protein [Gemmatimonadetes bacterium]|nr:glycosyltransferase family 2 protein [Gemmatimonadota bacterium]MCK5489752.1 glycosyltransferase family 2 protein [Gemmatimonadota bacterium]